ncbi:MAG: hypothetical protein ACE5GX_10465 [Thermoanaerobaculia bacterium]
MPAFFPLLQWPSSRKDRRLYKRSQLSQSLTDSLARYDEVYAIVSPPRCSSTAFARVFWEQPSIRYYCHEPFETTYYQGEDLRHVEAKLCSPLDLGTLKNVRGSEDSRGLVIKEMPYQVGDRFPLLAAIATRPVVFLLRDPRLSIASRMRKKRQVGASPLFPQVESGWELLREQIRWCRESGIAHRLVDSKDFRNRPLRTFPELFDALGLPFESGMLDWRPCPEVELDNLGGRHSHLYGAVLRSSGLLASKCEPPELSSFPHERDWRKHVAHCLEIYGELRELPERIRPAAAFEAPSSSAAL